MNAKKRLLSMLSLCMKAGKLQTGETAAERSLANGEAHLVLVTEDASENTKNKFINKCFYYKKPVLVYGSRDDLSKSVGKTNRAVYVITDIHFSERLQSLVQEAGGEKQEGIQKDKPINSH